MQQTPNPSHVRRLFPLLIPLLISAAFLAGEVSFGDQDRIGTVPFVFRLSSLKSSSAEVVELEDSNESIDPLTGHWSAAYGAFGMELDLDKAVPSLVITPLSDENSYQHKDVVANLTRQGRLVKVKSVQCLKYSGYGAWALLHKGCPPIHDGDKFILSRAGEYQLKLKYRLGEIVFHRD